VCETENFSVDESWLSPQPLATELQSQSGLPLKLAVQEKELIEAALSESGGQVFGRRGCQAGDSSINVRIEDCLVEDQ